jgi:ERF superfamily
MMKTSDSITAIAPALVKAQALIEDAVKDSSNPAFRSKYADLSAVLAVIRKPMADNDLCVLQSPDRSDGGVEVETRILHKSGEWISQSCFIPITKWDAHGTGSGITYGRRYGLMAIFCIGTEDDDGNTAVQSGPAAPAKKPMKMADPNKVLDAGRAAAANGTDALRDWFKGLGVEERTAATSMIDELKALAAEKDATK